MSYESNLEDAVYEVRDFLRANYDAYLQGVNSGKTDAVVAESIKTQNIEVRELDPFDTTEYPAMAIYPAEPDDIQVGAMTLGSDELTMPVTAVIAISHGDSTTQIRKLLRYTEALRQLLAAYLSFDTSFDVERGVRVKVYPTTPDEQAVKIATVAFVIKSTIQ
jgi:hypothetical protein